MKRTLQWMGLAICVGASGCSFEAAGGAAAITTNTCAVDADCTSDARCDGTMCVARSVESSLSVMLEVTPLQQPDGPQPVQFTVPRFEVENGRITQQWILPRPIRVRGRVRKDGNVVNADVTLTAPRHAAGLLPKVAMVAVAGTADVSAGFDYEVRVADAGEYTVRVQPKDTNLPPVERIVAIEDNTEIEVDYDKIDIEEIALELKGAKDERRLVVRAFDLATGVLISSTAPVVDNVATLRFAGAPSEYRVVVRPDDAYDPEGLSNDLNCDHDTPVLPSFTIDSSTIDVENGKATLLLPTSPARVSYAGTIELCEAPNAADALPDTLPVTLRSTSIMLDELPSDWRAEVATDTEAIRMPGTESYKFCVDVFQGNYDLIVTPPASQPCEIFAEHREVVSQDGEGATAELVQMLTAAQLRGELQTTDRMPLAAASVDVQSLGREGVLRLEADDSSITGYNRSRQTTTDETGAFSLPVDRGSYDVTLKPPVGSGYAWYVRRDVTIGAHREFTNVIDMSSPIAVDCSIAHEDADEGTLAGAEITAYALVTDIEGVERAIAIGKAVADESGQFMLLLPTAVWEGWFGTEM